MMINPKKWLSIEVAEEELLTRSAVLEKIIQSSQCIDEIRLVLRSYSLETVLAAKSFLQAAQHNPCIVSVHHTALSLFLTIDSDDTPSWIHIRNLLTKSPNMDELNLHVCEKGNDADEISWVYHVAEGLSRNNGLRELCLQSGRNDNIGPILDAVTRSKSLQVVHFWKPLVISNEQFLIFSQWLTTKNNLWHVFFDMENIHNVPTLMEFARLLPKIQIPQLQMGVLSPQRENVTLEQLSCLYDEIKRGLRGYPYFEDPDVLYFHEEIDPKDCQAIYDCAREVAVRNLTTKKARRVLENSTQSNHDILGHLPKMMPLVVNAIPEDMYDSGSVTFNLVKYSLLGSSAYHTNSTDSRQPKC